MVSRLDGDVTMVLVSVAITGEGRTVSSRNVLKAGRVVTGEAEICSRIGKSGPDVCLESDVSDAGVPTNITSHT